MMWVLYLSIFCQEYINGSSSFYKGPWTLWVFGLSNFTSHWPFAKTTTPIYISRQCTIAILRKKKKILGHIFFDPPLRASLFNKVTRQLQDMRLAISISASQVPQIFTFELTQSCHIEKSRNKTNNYLTGLIITCGYIF